MRVGMCGRCQDDGVYLFPALCAEKPEQFRGAPIGMYHCPNCGAMVVAGVEHPDVCAECRDRRRPGIDCSDGDVYEF